MKITIDELYWRSGVSPSTVSRTLNGGSAISEGTKRGISPPGRRIES